jgi:hypothetical protein
MALSAALATSAASQQQPAPPAPAAAQEAALSEALVAALSAPRHAEDALRLQHGDAAVLSALLDVIERCPGCPEEPLARGQAFLLLRELVGDGASADAEQDARIGNVLRPALHDRVARREAIGTVPALRGEEQRALIPALLPLLDDQDLVVVTDVVRALGRLRRERGTRAGRGCRRCSSRRRRPRTAGLRSPAGRPPRRARDHGRRGPRRAALLDARRRRPRGGLAGRGQDPAPDERSSGTAAPRDSPSRTSCWNGIETEGPPVGEEGILQGWLCRGCSPTTSTRRSALAPASWPHGWRPATIRDSRSSPLLPRAAGNQLRHGGAPARGCAVGGGAFRPASQLLTAAETRRGLLAVSSCSRATTPAGFPPKVSTLHVWDVEGGTPLQRIDGVQGSLLVAAIDASGQRLVIGTEGSVPQRPADGLLVCALDGSARVVIGGHEAGVRQLALSADGRRAASFADDGSLRVTDLSAARVLDVQSYAKGAVPTAVALRPDGERLVAGFADLSLRLESVAPFECLVTGSTRDRRVPIPHSIPCWSDIRGCRRRCASSPMASACWSAMPAEGCSSGIRAPTSRPPCSRRRAWASPPSRFRPTVGARSPRTSAPGSSGASATRSTSRSRSGRRRPPRRCRASRACSRPRRPSAFVGEDRVLGLTGSVLRVWRLDP